MNILVLGGTIFLGRHLVETAIRRGHRVTLFNRGRSNPGLFPDAQTLVGDRNGDLSGLAGRRWDAVIDTCGHTPDAVGATAGLLAGIVPHYTYVSSIAVLRNPGRPGQDETAPVATLPAGADTSEVTPASYGALKAACETMLAERFDGRTLVVRPGLVAGPYDPTDRFTYWPRRLSKGAKVLAPPASHPVQFIDVRDLADWIVRSVEAGTEGTYFAAGPAERLTMGRLLAIVHNVIGAHASYEWVDEEFLLENHVEPFVELPLWVPSGQVGYVTVDASAAQAKGLIFRPMAETIFDTLAWDSLKPIDRPFRAGLKAEREAFLLAKWQRARRLAWRSA